MKVVFVSNYFNHHQRALSDALYKETNGNYTFIQTMPMENERIRLGWGETLPAYVKLSYGDFSAYQACVELINDADVVIAGNAPEKMVRARIRAGKLLFRYSERIYKNKRKLLQLPLRFIKYHWNNHPPENIYLLCASAYAAGDYRKTRNFVGKAYKWGYFPVVTHRHLDELIARKNENPRVSLLWVGRLIGLKHPEVAVLLAKRLRDEGYSFDLDIIGSGDMEKTLEDMIQANSLQNNVHMRHAMPPEQVREHMDRADIFLSTSDYNEGWGAVLNESMNSACAVVSSHAVGAAPFLINNGVNGFIYQNADVEDAFVKVKKLINETALRQTLAAQAHKTISDIWGAEQAAKRFVELANVILEGGNAQELYHSGPCSKA